METWVPLGGTVCVFKSLYFCPHTLFRMCTCISTCIYAHLTLHVCSTPMHSYMETWVPMCDTVCVCCIHPTSGATPWLECVFASVHVFMSTWLQMSPETTMHSYVETWVPLYGTVFVSQSPHFCSHALFRKCTCISTCIYVIQSSKFCSTPLHRYVETWIPMCGMVCMFQSVHFWSHTLFRMCTCIRTCNYVHLTPHISSTPYG